MEICGFEKFSMVDYDTNICCTVFTKGCNFRCPFCHNSPLVETEKYNKTIDLKEVFDYLEKRKNLVDAVCISGGEPTLQSDLIEFVEKIKNLNYLVKLDTNGYRPKVLKTLLDKNLVDYVAMDIKNSKEKYCFTAGAEIDVEKIEQSVDILKNSDIDYEFRTTIISEFHTINDIEKISQWLSGATKYYLQKYKDDESCIQNGFSDVDIKTINTYLPILKKTINFVGTRGYN